LRTIDIRDIRVSGALIFGVLNAGVRRASKHTFDAVDDVHTIVVQCVQSV
jgi:hypothetical protein